MISIITGYPHPTWDSMVLRLIESCPNLESIGLMSPFPESKGSTSFPPLPLQPSNIRLTHFMFKANNLPFQFSDDRNLKGSQTC